MSRIKCFLIEPTGEVAVYFRRYRSPDMLPANHCPLRTEYGKYHNAMTFIENESVEHDSEGYISNGIKPLALRSDPRWPTQCACGYVFQIEDEWQRFTETLYHRPDTGEVMQLRHAPAGAMWYAWWMDRFHKPQGEHNLVVMTPGGEWAIDSQASNCSMKDDWKQEKHHCWVWKGTPPDIDVGKDGPTCSAGAGSIQCGGYHGFLRNGHLES